MKYIILKLKWLLWKLSANGKNLSWKKIARKFVKTLSYFLKISVYVKILIILKYWEFQNAQLEFFTLF